MASTQYDEEITKVRELLEDMIKTNDANAGKLNSINTEILQLNTTYSALRDDAERNVKEAKNKARCTEEEIATLCAKIKEFEEIQKIRGKMGFTGGSRRISALKDEIETKKKYIAKLLSCKTPEQVWAAKEKKKDQLTKEYNAILEQMHALAVSISSLQKKLSELTELQQQSLWVAKFNELREKYIQYAKTNGVSYDENDDEDLVFRCNCHHQQALLDVWHIDTPCFDDYDCTGWSVHNRRCDCGNYKGWYWENDDVVFSDILEFNIESKKPAGYPARG